MNSGKESGFNLIEVAMTSLILAIGLLGIVAMQGIAKKSLGDSDKQIEAAFHARTVLAELRNDTQWISATSSSDPTQEEEILNIIALSASSAVRNDLSICHFAIPVSGAVATSANITVAVSWQIQDEASALPQSNDEDCGVDVEHRREVELTAMISQGGI